MKNYILFFITFLSVSCIAQSTFSLSSATEQVYSNNNYIKDSGGILNKFVGTWKWTDPSDSSTYLILKLRKELHWNPNDINNFFIDTIIGNYEYVANGITITSTLDYNSNDLYSNYPVIFSNISKSPHKDLLINMTDVLKNKFCKAEFKLIDTNASIVTATWKMSSVDEIRIGSDLTPIKSGFSIPDNVILTKQ